MNNIPGFSDERQTASRKWLRRFLVCHPDITLKKAHNLSIAQAMGANPTVIGNWFQLLKKIQDTAGIISPDQIWSGDETGVQNIPKEVKVLGVKHIRTFQQVSSEQGETSTIPIFCQCQRKGVPTTSNPQGPMSSGNVAYEGPRRYSTFSNNERIHYEESFSSIWSTLHQISEA